MGQSDSPLTKVGLMQSETTTQELKDIHFDAIFSSDLGRAKKTAEIIRLKRRLIIQTSKALRERNFGHFEGMPAEEYRKKFKYFFDILKKLSEKEQKEFKFADDIESDIDVINRFTNKLKKIAAVYPKKTVLVVNHGGCIRTFLMHIGYAKYGELPVNSFSNAGYVKVLYDGSNFFVKKVKGIKKTILNK